MGSHSLTARHRLPGNRRALQWTAVPQLVQWMATLRCPLSCPHCLAATRDGGFADMPLQTVAALIDQVADLKVNEFLITGGEPLVRKDLPEVIRHLGRREVRWSLNTATLPDTAARAAMEAVPPVFVAVSLDGPETVHNRFRGSSRAFADALEAIRFFAGLPGCRVAAGTTVTSFNFDSLAETFPIVVESGAAEWGIHLPVREGRAETRADLFLSRGQLRQLLRFVARRRNYFPVQMADEMSYCGAWEPLVRDQPLVCGAGRTHCVVLPDGEVVPCSTLDRSESAGNIHETPLEEIWTKGFADIRSWKPRRKCAACSYARACEGGCWLQRRRGTECFKDVWQMPGLLRTAAGIAVCLTAFQGSAAGESAAAPEEPAIVDLAPGLGGGFKAIGVATVSPWVQTDSSPIETFVTRWYTREFPPVRALEPLTVPAVLEKDPASAYLQALLDGRLPGDIPSLCRQTQAALLTEQRSLAFSSLLWRNLSESLLNGKPPEARTEEEQRAIRETLALLQTKTDAWRKEIFKVKLDAHLAAAGQAGNRAGAGGAFGSKAGPRPRPYHDGLAKDIADERWEQSGAGNEAVENFLQQHPFAQDHELQLSLPKGAEWRGNTQRERTIGVFDTLFITNPQRANVSVQVKWDARKLERTAHASLCWEGTVELPANVELTYVDVLRHAQGSVRNWESKSSALPNGPFAGYPRPGYFHHFPLNPLLLADVRARYRPSGAVAGPQRDPKEVKRIEALIKQLGDEDYETRTTAQKKLWAMGDTIRDVLSAYQDYDDAEIRTRVRTILNTSALNGNTTLAVPEVEEKRLLLLWLTDFWML